MSRSAPASQARIAEKLTILNDRGEGLLTRLYDLKKTLANQETRPPLLTDKSLDSVIKTLEGKRFPNVGNGQSFTNVINANMRNTILQAMHPHYYTLVDMLEFKDSVGELLVTIDANQIHFDVSINFDLTKRYLDLVATYVAMMLMVSRVNDRRAILGLYNIAYEMQHGNRQESSFPRLAQLILDYQDAPIKKMVEEFVPHVRCLTFALLSLKSIYQRRDLTAEQWRNNQYLSIISDPTRLMEPARSETVPCEYLSLDTMQRWIVLGFLLIHQQLVDPNAAEMWKQALSSGWVIQLWRDEVFYMHSFIEKSFERIKGYEKRTRDVKDSYYKAVQESPVVHKDRRKFLRMALREMNLLFIDQPGLLAPKAMLAFMMLSHARDEIQWLLRHAGNAPQVKGKAKFSADDLNDRQLPELLFYVEELRGLVKKYSQVLQRYYVQYLKGYDLAELGTITSVLPKLSEDDSNILQTISRSMDELTVRQVEEGAAFDFTGFRLDWVRLQAYTSTNKTDIPLKDNRTLAKLLNTIMFHTKMVDYLDEILNETSDLSLYCFYTTLFELQFKQCMEFPAQHRYSVAFPLICAHFLTTVHQDMCPEERQSIGQTSVQYCNWFLKEIADEVNQVITTICEEQVRLNDKVLPKHCVQKFTLDNRRPGQGKKKKQRTQSFKDPGEESKRKCREEFTKLDKLHMALTELSYALNYTPVIHVWGHGFVPREFFIHNLEGRFNKALPGMLMHNPDNDMIAKPSEVLAGVKAMMDVLQTLENYIHVDISRIFNNVLLQQTQPVDGLTGEPTFTQKYTNWYLDILLRHVSMGHIIYSPLQKAFVSLSSEEKLPFSAEEFSDVKELRSLCELLGPYGMRHMGEQLMYRVALQINELKSLVIANKATLIQIRTAFEKPDVMAELAKKLENPENVLQRLTIIGVLLSFRHMLQEVLYDSMVSHAPFLMSSIKDFSDNVPGGSDKIYVNEMAGSAGFDCAVDPLLVAAIRNQKPELNEDQYKLSCLLMVFIAVAIPRRAASVNSTFEANLQGHANNTHCIGKAINQLAQAMFLVHSRDNDVEERLKEFLALASSSLLRLGQENEKEAIRTRESVYLLLHIIVQESNVLSMDLLESCFPYALLRNAYSAVINNTSATTHR